MMTKVNNVQSTDQINYTKDGPFNGIEISSALARTNGTLKPRKIQSLQIIEFKNNLKRLNISLSQHVVLKGPDILGVFDLIHVFVWRGTPPPPASS